jgi:hypothetical protein
MYLQDLGAAILAVQHRKAADDSLADQEKCAACERLLHIESCPFAAIRPAVPQRIAARNKRWLISDIGH